jgi:hypothetical protein
MDDYSISPNAMMLEPAADGDELLVVERVRHGEAFQS